MGSINVPPQADAIMHLSLNSYRCDPDVLSLHHSRFFKIRRRMNFRTLACAFGFIASVSASLPYCYVKSRY